MLALGCATAALAQSNDNLAAVSVSGGSQTGLNAGIRHAF
jgi:hypothetical protein